LSAVSAAWRFWRRIFSWPSCRDATGARVRDKIAQSKKLGMWMGGFAPLGYRSKGRTLEIDEDEAKTVRVIFARYLALGSVHRLVAELGELGIMSRRRTTNAGQEFGGVPFTRGPLFHLLRNRTYLGEIPHKDTSYPGQHSGIIDRETFAQVQELLSKAAARCDSETAPTETAPEQTRPLFVGRIRDEHGRPMTPTRAQKGGRHYRYYISRGPEHGGAASPHKRRRISASLLEETCLERLRRLGLLSPTADRGEIRNIIEEIEVGARVVVLTIAAAVIERAGGEDLIRLKLVSGDQLVVTGASATLHLVLTTKRTGLKTVAFGPSGSNALQRPQLDHVLTSALLKAETWKRKMLGGEVAKAPEKAGSFPAGNQTASSRPNGWRAGPSPVGRPARRLIADVRPLQSYS
jgi:site-specific DNA recombinase